MTNVDLCYFEIEGYRNRQERNLCQQPLTLSSLALDCIYHSASIPGIISKVLLAHILSLNLPLRSTYLHRSKEFTFSNPIPVPTKLEKIISEAKARHKFIIESLKKLTGKMCLPLPVLTCIRILSLTPDTAWHLWYSPRAFQNPG